MTPIACTIDVVNVNQQERGRMWYVNGSLYVENKLPKRTQNSAQERLSLFNLTDTAWWQDDFCSYDNHMLSLHGVPLEGPVEDLINEAVTAFSSNGLTVNGSLYVSSIEPTDLRRVVIKDNMSAIQKVIGFTFEDNDEIEQNTNDSKKAVITHA
jgi:hypothetical protein